MKMAVALCGARYVALSKTAKNTKNGKRDIFDVFQEFHENCCGAMCT